jgi:glucose/arabinose dehydrogenase
MIRLTGLFLLLMSCQNQGEEANKPSIAKNPITPVTKGPERITPDPGKTHISTGTNAVKQYPVLVQLATGDSFQLQIPAGYQLSIAAQGLKRLRFLSKSPDGRLFATNMYNRDDNHRGSILIFENWRDSDKTFDTIITYLHGLHNPNQAAFYKNYIYIAETDKLTRFAYHAGDQKPTDSGEIIMRFPAYGLSYKYGGWHLTRSIAFHNDKLYVSVGSSCNACLEKETIRASVLEMNPDGSDMTTFARGLRNTVGLKWIGNTLFGTGMGRDGIGPDKPEDVFQKIDKDGFYGWPFYYQFQQKVYADDQFKDSITLSLIETPPLALMGFKAHSAPLGFEHFKNFDDSLFNNCVLVCLHGSTSVWRQRGNAIVKLENNNQYSPVISGFLTGKTEADRHGRPCDIMMQDNHSFFFTDDLNGVLYFIWKKQ